MSPPHDPNKFAPGISEAESQPADPVGVGDPEQKRDDAEKRPLSASDAVASAPVEDEFASKEPIRDDAPVWKEYLDVAKAYDEKLGKVLNSDLDSLLIFAGLFSAILSAFLIEIRKDLHEDPQSTTNILLTGIIQRLDNQTPTPLPQFQTARSSVWVNSLWFLSLTLSLMSALGASLAKGWIAQYSATATSGVNAHAACLRHERWIGVSQWHLKFTIDCIPLFIHAAFFAFFAGLVILLRQDDTVIQEAVLGLVVVAIVAYAATTFLPIIFPDCPFRTPVSAIFIGGISKLRSIPMVSWKLAPNLMAGALEWLLLQSTEKGVVQMSVDAIAALPQCVEVQDALSQRHMASVLAQGLSESISNIRGQRSSLLVATKEHHQVQAYLYAILHLVQTGSLRTSIHKPLVDLILPGGPLYEWKDLGSETAEVALCVKARITLLHFSHTDTMALFNTEIPIMFRVASNSQIKTMLAEIVILTGLNLGVQDFNPWLLAKIKNDKQHIRMEGLKTLSDYTRNELKKPVAHGIAPIVQNLKNSDRHIQCRAIETIQKFATHDGLRQGFIKCGGIEIVIGMLQKDLGVNQMAWQKMMEHVISYRDVRAKIINSNTLGNLFGLLEHISDIQKAGLQVLSQLSIYEDIRKKIISNDMIFKLFVLLQNCNSDYLLELSTTENLQIQLKKLDTAVMLFNLLQHFESDLQTEKLPPLLQIPTYKNIKSRLASPDMIVTLFSLLQHYEPGVRIAGLQVLLKLLTHENIRANITNNSLAISMLNDLLQHYDSEVQGAAIQVILKLSIYADTHANIISNDMITILFTLLQHYKSSVRQASIQAIIQLSTYDDIQAKILTNDRTSTFVSLLQHYNCDVQIAGLHILSQLSAFKNIRAIILNDDVSFALFGLLQHYNSDIQIAGLQTLSELSHYEGIHQILLTTEMIIKIVGLIKDNKPEVQTAGLKALSELLIYEDFRLNFIETDIITSTIKSLKDHKPDVEASCVQAILQLAVYENFQMTPSITDILTWTVSSLKDNSLTVRKAALQVLSQFSSIEIIQTELIKTDMVTIIINSLKEENSAIQASSLQTLSQLVVHDDVRAKLISTDIISIFIGILKDNDTAVRKAGIELISKLITYEDIQEKPLGTVMITTLISSLEDTNLMVQDIAVKAISDLLQQSTVEATLLHHLIQYLSEKLFHQSIQFQCIAAATISKLGQYEFVRIAVKPDLILCLLNMLGSSSIGACIIATDALAALGLFDRE